MSWNKDAAMLVYRAQPANKELGNHRSETSNGGKDCGVHVCCSLSELACAICGWCKQPGIREVVTIECKAGDVRDNGDYEGSVLVANRGKIVERKLFKSWRELEKWARDFKE